MPLIYLETRINAAPQIVFDLSRSVDLHKASMLHHKEEIVDGVQNGLMHKGDTVTWEARHLWRHRRLKVKLTELAAPHFFVDEMVAGDFKKMKHEHQFNATANGTKMIDRFYFETPFGIFGQIINVLFLKAYMTRLLRERNRVIKAFAEGNRAKQYLHT